MAEREAAKVEILAAQMRQAQAEVALLEDQLSHTKVVAPFDGIVVTGDLSQQLGAPPRLLHILEQNNFGYHLHSILGHPRWRGQIQGIMIYAYRK